MLSNYRKDSDSDGQYSGLGNTQYDPEIENVGVDPYHEQEEVDEKGFQKRIQGDQDIFIFKNVVLPGIPANQKIKRMAVSE